MDPIEPRDQGTTDIDPPAGGLTDCSVAGGTVHSSGGSSRWTANGSPHRVNASVTIDGSLVIEPGALVCVATGATLTVTDSLLAVGTASDSIRILPATPGGSWSVLELGLCCNGYMRSHLRYVRVSSAWVRVARDARIEHSIVDGGIGLHPYSTATIEHTIVREGSIGTARRTALTLSAVRIEDSPGTGLSLYSHVGGETRLTIDQPIRIVGAADYPFSGALNQLDELVGAPGVIDSLTGNGRDTLELFAVGGTAEPVTRPQTLSRHTAQLIRTGRSASGSRAHPARLRR